jgi:hypothetical protein
VCNRWFASNREDGVVRRELFALEPATVSYVVYVYTGDRDDAGTDCKVHLRLLGTTGETRAHELANPSVRTTFARGQKDVFVLRDRDVGALRQCAVWVSGGLHHKRWFICGVVARNERTHAEAVFPAYKWLATGGEKGEDSRAVLHAQIGASIHVKGSAFVVTLTHRQSQRSQQPSPCGRKRRRPFARCSRSCTPDLCGCA